MGKKAIKCSKMFNSNNGSVMENVVIFTDGERIESVKTIAEAGACDGYDVIDLGDRFVTPGLIDCHMHLTGNGEGSTLAVRPYQTLGTFVLKALKNVQEDIMAGFTSIRSCGDPGFIDVSLRNAINRGEFKGPRLMVPGVSLATTGGHSDSHYSPYIEEPYVHNVGNGTAAIKKAVRYNIKHGADYIKFMATGGVMSLGTTVGAQQMSFEEMKAICDTAKMYGCITATHAHGTSGIRDAIRAGVTSVEHGMLMDDEGRELMTKMGTTLVPTLIAAERIVEMGSQIGTPQWAIDKANQVYERACDGFRKCLEMGIPIAFGTDAATPHNFHGKQAYEFELMVKNGMTPTQALTSATKTGSELMRKQNEIGSIDAGKYADIVAFDGDPMTDIKAMMNCSFVMKGGEVLKN